MSVSAESLVQDGFGVSVIPFGKIVSTKLTIYKHNHADYVMSDEYEGYLTGRRCPICGLSFNNCNGHRVVIRTHAPFVFPLYRQIFLHMLNNTCIIGTSVANNDIFWARDKHCLFTEGIRSKLTKNVPKECAYCRGSSWTWTWSEDKETPLLLVAKCVKDETQVVHRTLAELREDLRPHAELIREQMRMFGINLSIIDLITEYVPVVPPSMRVVINETNQLTTAYVQLRTITKDADLATWLNRYARHKTGVELAATTESLPIDRLSGKTGFVRAHVLSRGTSNIARFVLGPSSGKFGTWYLSRHADKLVCGTDVTRYNIDLIREIGTMNMITRVYKAKTRQWFAWSDFSDALEPGDSVLRHIVDGDFVLANRQPSLHKFNMMAHSVRMHNRATVALHPAETTPYNADNDGDEMNTHSANSAGAALDMQTVAHVFNMMMKGSKPAMAPFFHERTALYAMGLRRTEDLDSEYVAARFLAAYERARDWDIRAKTFATRRRGKSLPTDLAAMPNAKPRLETFGDVLSLMLPFDFNYRYKGQIVVRAGIFMDGKYALDKKILGDVPGSIVHEIHNKYGGKRTAMFVNDCVEIARVYMREYPISLPIRDFGLGAGTDKELEESTAKSREIVRVGENVSKTINDIIKGRELATSQAQHDVIDRTIGRVWLRQFNELLEQLTTENVSHENGLLMLIKSGARGNDRSYAQLRIFVGQEMLFGRLMAASKLPYFVTPEQQKSALANGFIDRSYVAGLTPAQIAVHAAACRGKIISSNLNISTSGDVANRLGAALGSTTLRDDWALRAGLPIIDFHPGGLLAPESLVRVTVNGRTWSTFCDIMRLADEFNTM